MIKAEKIGIKYEGKIILSDISFEINTGDKLVFAGPSGSGKTSLVNVLLGFIRPFSGRIFFNEKEAGIKAIKQFRNQCAWIPQDVFFNYELAVDLVKVINTNTYNKEKLLRLLEKANLNSEVLEKNTGKLSGGEKQRLLIVACLLKDKPVLILDEPTSALDEQNIDEITEMILGNSNLTVISTSHNKNWIKACNNIIEL
jgi:ABC-type multidrug transport system ATPase subunit